MTVAVQGRHDADDAVEVSSIHGFSNAVGLTDLCPGNGNDVNEWKKPEVLHRQDRSGSAKTLWSGKPSRSAKERGAAHSHGN